MIPVDRTHPRTAARPRSRALRVGAAILCAVALASGDVAQGDSDVDEYEIKAVFLLNFMRFTTWPSSRFEDESSPIVVAVFGKDPFGRKLETILKGKSVGERRIAIRRYARLEAVKDCHLLFVPKGERRHVPALQKKLGTKGVLYVGESKDFAVKGGLVNFFEQEERFRFEINAKAATAAGLKFSSSLLKHARIVEIEEEER